MENLARIISHGFAIVVVVLLGVGFIYRGELFPDLELPDFLVPESGKTAAIGAHADKLQSETKVTPESPRGEPGGEAPPRLASAAGQTRGANTPESGEAVAIAPGAATGKEATTVEVQPPAVEQTAVVGGSAGEASQAPVAESQSPVAEVPAAGEKATVQEAMGTAAANSTGVPVPQSAEEAPVESSVETPASGTGTQAPSELRESSPVPEISPGTQPQSGSQTAGAGGQPAAVETGPRETASGSGTPWSQPPPVAAPTSESAAADTTQATGTTPAQATPYELLAAAREAFWMHNYDDAEKNYRALIKLEPDDPDGYGELGNMYFSQGRWDEAAAAYYEAGTRLVSEGRLEPARKLVNVIRGLNGTQADALDKLVNAAAADGNN